MSEKDMVNGKWKGKYHVRWCELCCTAIIECPVCKNTSCNVGACKECEFDFTEFHETTKHRIESYLTEEEKNIYHKTVRLKKYMLDTLRENQNQIDWHILNQNNKLSRYDADIFLK